MNAYNRTFWEDDPKTDTALEATLLNNAEKGIFDNRQAIRKMEEDVAHARAVMDVASDAKNTAVESAEVAVESARLAEKYKDEASRFTPEGYDELVRKVDALEVGGVNAYVEGTTLVLEFGNGGSKPTGEIVDFIPAMSDNDKPVGSIASLAETPYGGMWAYFAFDGNENTSACGASSATSIDLSYEDTKRLCMPTSLEILCKNSGSNLLVEGVDATGAVTKLLEVSPQIGVKKEYALSTNKYFKKFRFYVTGGLATGTPMIAEAQIKGYVKEQ